tara:strand:- start:4609 stop:7143 length:2535 start_codon:yes stop_codon:yes gene_type:complete
MAQPRDYSRQHNFNDFATTSPASPLPGQQVDNELNAVKLTLDDLNTNIGIIQRDDGKIRNQSVHKDAFDVDALALISSGNFNPRGDWASGTAFAVGDIVNFNNATYYATSAHTSSNAFQTDLSASKWLLIANAAIANTASAVDKFEGDGNTTAFTLSYAYTGNTDALVFVNGALRNPGDDYTLSGTTITFVTAPSSPSVVGNENVIIWGTSVVVAAAKTAAESASSNAQAFRDTAQDWASKVNGDVDSSSEYSAKAHAIGGTGVDTGTGSAKDWATKTSGTVGNSGEYSAKYYATDANVGAVATNITNVNTVAGQISPTNNIGTLASRDADIGTVASRDTDIGTVAARDADIGTVAGQISPTNNLGTVAARDTDIGTVASRDADIGTVAARDTDIQSLAAITSDITSLANAIGVSTTYTVTVAQSGGVNVFYIDGVANPTLTLDRGNTYIFDQSDNTNANHPLIFKDSSGNSYTTGVTVSGVAGQSGATVTIDVASNAPGSLVYSCSVHGNAMGNSITVVNSNLSLVASNITSVNTVANSTNLANITAVAGDAADIGTVAADIGGSNTIGTVATDLTGSNTIGSVGSAITNINNVAGALTAINNVSTNLSSVQSFGETYYVSATEPSPTTLGDLWFDTTNDVMKVKASTGFVNAGSSVNGTSERKDYVVGTSQGSYTGSTTIFPAVYDAGFVDVYLNGVKLQPADFTATNGTNVELLTAAQTNDTVSIIGYGTFVIQTLSTNNLSDVSSAGVTNGQVLAYNSSSGDFEPTTITVPPSDLVNDTSPQLGGTLDTNNQAIQFGTSKWTIELDGNNLLFKYNGTAKIKFADDGEIVTVDDVTAFGTI